MASDECTVALVHGCTQGPRGWDRIRDLLSGSGVRSVVVDLDPRDFDGTTALECASHIAHDLENHEHHLVFVCAGLPDIGRSATDQIFNDGLLHHDWLHYSGEPDSLEAAARFMFNDCDGDVLTWSLSTVRLFMPQPAYDEVTPLESWPHTPSTYLLGTKDQIISQRWARAAVPARLGHSPIELPTGHCPQNSKPELVSEVLTRLANQMADGRGSTASRTAISFTPSLSPLGQYLAAGGVSRSSRRFWRRTRSSHRPNLAPTCGILATSTKPRRS